MLVEGPIYYGWCMKHKLNDEYLATILETRVEYADPDVLSSATRGWLRICVRLAMGFWDTERFRLSKKIIICGLGDVERKPNASGQIESFLTIYFDTSPFKDAPRIYFDEY
jgi:hypothetical protein